MATSLLTINNEIFSSKLFDKTIFRQCVQSTKSHLDKVTFRRNGSLDEVSFDEVLHFDIYNEVLKHMKCVRLTGNRVAYLIR